MSEVEPVTVWTGQDGLPRRFVWRDRLFVVQRVLRHWIGSRELWREPGPGQGPVREFWRVEASPGRDAGVYDLHREPGTDTWTLSRVWR
ncbi:DUF6504 family protein [Actinocorallia sp. API 0066]|uniref:DUF6504 family protein n=1 Tax=Actinocorallia sp. API 0066 TaxID=2896846 RepID=UPI001E39A309|nr:DUF6504 family protein [Actinocorallia sp. API 0066]MCD0452769.1 DUF6504 family protein [Actinocorallia sp. API 0066]